MFLTDAELAKLTGRAKPSAQIRELERQAIPHTVNAAGRPVVLWASVEARHGLREKVSGGNPVVIDFSVLRRA